MQNPTLHSTPTDNGIDIVLVLCLYTKIGGIQCRHIVCNVYYKITEYVLPQYEVLYSHSLRHIMQATFFVY